MFVPAFAVQVIATEAAPASTSRPRGGCSGRGRVRVPALGLAGPGGVAGRAVLAVEDVEDEAAGYRGHGDPDRGGVGPAPTGVPMVATPARAWTPMIRFTLPLRVWATADPAGRGSG